MALSRDPHDVAIAFEDAEGSALAAAFDDLLGQQTQSGLMVQLGDYPEVFQTAFGDRTVRRAESATSHLHIYGQLEARLTQSDRVILGGLVEGVWPPAPRTDPWLSRPMRHELGLDLNGALACPRTISRNCSAQRKSSSATPPRSAARPRWHRFLHRLEAVAGKRAGDREGGRRKYVRLPMNWTARQGRADPDRRQRAACEGRPQASVTATRTGCAILYDRRHLEIGAARSADLPLSAADRARRSGSARRIHKDFLTTARRSRAPCAASAKYFALERPEARALWWPRSCASPAGSRIGKSRGAAVSAPSPPRSAGTRSGSTIAHRVLSARA